MDSLVTACGQQEVVVGTQASRRRVSTNTLCLRWQLVEVEGVATTEFQVMTMRSLVASVFYILNHLGLGSSAFQVVDWTVRYWEAG